MEEKRKQRVHEALSRFFSELPAFLLSSTKHESDFLEIRVQFSPIPENAPVTRKKKHPPSKIRRNRQRLEVFLAKSRNKANNNGAVDTDGEPGKILFETPTSAHGVDLLAQKTLECGQNVDKDIGLHLKKNSSEVGPGAERDGDEETTGGENGDENENEMEPEDENLEDDTEAKANIKKYMRQCIEGLNNCSEILAKQGFHERKIEGQMWESLNDCREILTKQGSHGRKIEETQSTTGAPEEVEETFESWEEEVERSTSDLNNGVAPVQEEIIHGTACSHALLSTPYNEWQHVKNPPVRGKRRRGKNKHQKDDCKAS